MGLVGFELTCRCCNQTFFVCKNHYRGHLYCSSSCRKVGYQRSRRQAKQRYNQKRKARRSNAKRQAAFRERQNSNDLISAPRGAKRNKVTDQSLILNKSNLNPLLHSASQVVHARRCSVCEEEIDILVRIDERRKNT